jgi:hypothetical protein
MKWVCERKATPTRTAVDELMRILEIHGDEYGGEKSTDDFVSCGMAKMGEQRCEGIPPLRKHFPSLCARFFFLVFYCCTPARRAWEGRMSSSVPLPSKFFFVPSRMMR